MPKMNLSHFEAAFLFSLFTSVVLGVVTKRDRPRPAALRRCTRSAVFCGAVRHRLADVPGPRLTLASVGDVDGRLSRIPGRNHFQEAVALIIAGDYGRGLADPAAVQLSFRFLSPSARKTPGPSTQDRRS